MIDVHISAAHRADLWLGRAARAWLGVAAVGLVLFAAYITLTYGAPALRGDLAAWSRSSLKGYETSDTVGNLVFGAHMAFGALISLCGVVQLLPAIRRGAPAVHRWSGRLFLTSAFILSLGGLHLVWVREAVLSLSAALGVSLNAILLMAFGALALRAARARDFAAHSRWALRTFIVAGGVWFQRLGYMAWVLINQGPVGMTRNLDGPFDMFLSFGAYLVPLAVVEIYLRARDGVSKGGKVVAVGVLVISILLTILGVGGAAALMWWPRVSQALAA